jgi:hypothetical protein
VGGEQNRLVELLEPPDDAPSRAAGGRVEAGGGLVEEDELGIAYQGERQVEPPPLAAGELLGARVGLLVEADEGDRLGRVARPRVGLGEVLDRLAHRRARVEAAALQHDPDALLEAAVAALGVLAEHAHLAGRAAPVALQDLDGGRLAGPIGPEQAEHLAALDAEGDAAHGLHVAVRLAQFGDLDCRHAAEVSHRKFSG